MKKGVITDIFTHGDHVIITLKTHQQKSIIKLDYRLEFYFTTPKFKNVGDYEKHNFSVVKSKKFLSNYTKDETLFGIVTCKNSEKFDIMKKIKRIAYPASFFNSNLELHERFIHQYKIFPLDAISIGMVNGSLNIEKIQIDDILLDHYSLYVEIETNPKRQDPVANWRMHAKKLNQSYHEMKDYSMQKILSIGIKKFDCENDSEVTFKNTCNNEFDVIEDFMNYFKTIQNIDVLLVWKPEHLDYIGERYDYLGGDINKFKNIVFKIQLDEKLKIEYLKFDSPITCIYIPVFYIYYSLGKSKCKGGFKESNISEYYFNSKYDGNDLIINLFKKFNQMNWIIKSNRIFLTTHRTFLSSFTSKLYKFIAYFSKDRYLICDDWVQWIEIDTVGGKFLEPDKYQFMENVISLDFIKFYTSIILEKNICYTTLCEEGGETRYDIPLKEVGKRERYNQERHGYYVNEEVSIGELPKIVSMLLEEREKIQSNMKKYHTTSVDYALLDQEQEIIKRFGNSVYGITKSRSLFYNPKLAESITSFGQDVLLSLKKLLEDNGIKIRAGMTDSLMVQGDVNAINKTIVQFNSRYRYIRVKIENVFDKMIFIGKSNYYAISSGKLILKGVDCVRKDMCKFTKDVCILAASYILGQIEDVKLFEIQLQKLFNTKKITDLIPDNYKFNNVRIPDQKENEDIIHNETYKKLEKILALVEMELDDLIIDE